MRQAAIVFLGVSGAALAGMVLGGLFGLAAGLLAPTLFATLVPWAELEPVGTAVVIGAAGGVLCGGGLGVFAVIVSAVAALWRGRAAGA